MNWFWSECRRFRREVCLLAIGALPEQDRPRLEQHLAACAGCLNYYNEIKSVAAPLAGWEKNFARIEPTQATRNRWAGAVLAAAAPAVRRPLLKAVSRNVWRELIWPCRRAWVGLAALWLVLAAVNIRLSDHPMQWAGAGSSSASAMMQSWEEQTRILAELTQPPVVYSPPVNTPLAPPNPARPRSERKQDWQIA
jgi:anti-sigma factor RsiW